MPQPNAKWYDEATLDEMHEDLKREYLKTLAVISQRPGLLKHFKSCAFCRAIEHAHISAETKGSVEVPAHRRRKLVLTHSDLRQILGLQPEQSIAALEVRQDPPLLSVILAGPNEPMTPINEESSITRISVEAA